MSSAIQASASMAGQQVFYVDVGNSGGTYGFSAALPIGSIAPAESYKGNAITAVIATSGPSFRLSIQGAHTTLFHQIIVERTDGSAQTLLASDAIRSGDTTTSWEWTVADLLWDSASSRRLTIFG